MSNWTLNSQQPTQNVRLKYSLSVNLLRLSSTPASNYFSAPSQSSTTSKTSLQQYSNPYLDKQNIPPTQIQSKQLNPIKAPNNLKTPIPNGLIQTKKKSIYDQYRQRIDQGITSQTYELKNPQLKALRSINLEFKDQILSDLERHRLVRQKSQKSLKRSQSLKDCGIGMRQQFEETGKQMKKREIQRKGKGDRQEERIKKQLVQKYRQKLGLIK